MNNGRNNVTDFFQSKRLAKFRNNPWYLTTITSLLLFLNLLVCSYQQCWRHVFAENEDLSFAMSEYSRSFYSNKYHIWYDSFYFYGLLFFLLAPLVMSCVYSKKYYDKADTNEIYRKGFLRYYCKSFVKALSVSAIFSGAAILLFWICLCIFAHGKGLYIEDSGLIPEAYVIPSITIWNESVKNMAIASPFRYVLYTFTTFFVSGISYCIYVYSIQTMLRSKITRLLLPTIGLIIADFVLGMLIPNFEDSLMFDLFNTACVLSKKAVILFNIGIWMASLVFLTIHYFSRKKNG